MATNRSFAIIECPKTETILMLAKGKGKKKRWGFPGGRVKRKELPLIGLLREIKEETGLELMNLVEEKTFKDSAHELFVFKSRLYSSSTIKLSKEHTDFMWIKKKMIRYSLLNRSARIILEGKII